jgi:hypothetical protein
MFDIHNGLQSSFRPQQSEHMPDPADMGARLYDAHFHDRPIGADLSLPLFQDNGRQACPRHVRIDLVPLSDVGIFIGSVAW